jgi:DNA polymerase III epsilon subunit-like protein
MKHVMIDLETLGTVPTSCWLTIAAVRFDPFADNSSSIVDGKIFNLDTFYHRVDIDSCDELKLTIDDSTIEWWSKQEQHVTKEAFDPKDRTHLKKIITEFYKWSKGCTHYWANGSYFDFPIMENVFGKYKRSTPWKYWEVMDYRTIYKCANVEIPKEYKHHALYDCVNQIVALQRAVKQLGITEFR